VAEFRRFVEATGHITVAERPLNPDDHPDAHLAFLQPRSLVFHKPQGHVNLDANRSWWGWIPDASWRQPEGPGSTTSGREQHPVVHVAWGDVLAYARWAGKELPTEAEWEFAARGGLEGKTYVWGDEFAPRGLAMANTWQGEFPWQNPGTDGFEGTAPVRSFPPNGYGLYEMAGNVWEWTADHWTSPHPDEREHACCGPAENARVLSPDWSFNPGQPVGQLPRHVVKGGSYLCAPDYCLRYRPAARQPQSIEMSAAHLGFRCILRP
jgi:sulfatase modifying factor 1